MKHPDRPSDQERFLDTDLATYLHTLAARLRGLALAACACATRQGDTGDPESAALVELAAAQERIARALELAAARLCDHCKLTGVTEGLTLLASAAPRRYRIRTAARKVREDPACGWGETDALA